nr:very short patch repair endonuclease [Methylocapsa acidiphila]
MEARSKAALRPPATDPARSAIMRAVKSTNTRPEMIVRSLAHRLGFRFRLHRKTLPGCPDLVFPTRRKAIFVNGCFWHGHDCKRGARAPKNNAAYWRAKIARNVTRDAQSNSALLADGWDVLTIWECEIKDLEGLAARLHAFLAGSPRSAAKRAGGLEDQQALNR